MSTLPQFANRPCGCGAHLRVGRDLDGKRLLLDAAPTASGSFFTVVAWNGSGAYLAEPEPGEYVDPRERFALHACAARSVAA